MESYTAGEANPLGFRVSNENHTCKKSPASRTRQRVENSLKDTSSPLGIQMKRGSLLGFRLPH